MPAQAKQLLFLLRMRIFHFACSDAWKSGRKSTILGSILVLDELLRRYGLAEKALHVVLMRLGFGSVKERIPGKDT
jgi:hypothetical protein